MLHWIWGMLNSFRYDSYVLSEQPSSGHHFERLVRHHASFELGPVHNVQAAEFSGPPMIGFSE